MTTVNGDMDVQRDSEDYLAKALEVRDGNLVSFLNDVFHFLSIRTNFYNGPGNDVSGYPPPIAKKIVKEIFETYNPSPTSNNENVFLPAVLAEEVEITTSDEQNVDSFSVDIDEGFVNYEEIVVPNESTSHEQTLIESTSSLDINERPSANEATPDVDMPKISTTTSEDNVLKQESMSKLTEECQSRDSESYNGAVRDTFSWSQNICELDVTVPIPSGIKSKQLDVNVTMDLIKVRYRPTNSQWVTLIDDKLTYKTKAAETLWTFNEGKIKIHLEKQIEKWWNSLIVGEPKIDTATLNCSRPLHELSEEHLAKIEEVQWNQKQKLAGLPTSDEIQKAEILKRAWNLPGSPFENTPYDPNIITP